MHLLLVRHGSTLDNEARIYCGQRDVPLSPLGEQQVRDVAVRLAAVPLDAIVTSDLQRARATAAAIARAHETPVPVYEDPDIRELNLGRWEGLTLADIMEFDAELIQLYRTRAADCPIPGGETLARLQARVMRALARWYERYPRGTVLWATHGGVIRVLLCSLHNVGLNDWAQFQRENATITEVDIPAS